MGSNFYPFTAARKGNKLVTKGLFSKLASEIAACLTVVASARIVFICCLWICCMLLQSCCLCRIRKAPYLLRSMFPVVRPLCHHRQSSQTSTLCSILGFTQLQGELFSRPGSAFFMDMLIVTAIFLHCTSLRLSAHGACAECCLHEI